MPSLKPMWDQRRLSTPSTPRGHQDASASATTATAQTPVRRPYTAWRGPTSNESRQPWQSQPLTPSKSRPYTAPLGSAAIAYGRACSRPLTGADGSHAARLPLPSAASHRDIVELRSRQSFPGPIRLRTPSAELRALDEAYDRTPRSERCILWKGRRREKHRDWRRPRRAGGGRSFRRRSSEREAHRRRVDPWQGAHACAQGDDRPAAAAERASGARSRLGWSAGCADKSRAICGDGNLESYERRLDLLSTK